MLFYSTTLSRAFVLVLLLVAARAMMPTASGSSSKYPGLKLEAPLQVVFKG